VFLTFADTRSLTGRCAEGELREDLGDLVLQTTVSRRIAPEYAAQAGLPAVVWEPNGPAAAEYRALTEEVLNRLEG
jgi:cellulose biosynthesis protein BcsQ